MCTVSYYKDAGKIVLTSNRDESIHRPNAFAPIIDYFNDTKLFFPKDPQGGGTWFVVNEHGSVFVLLNGADFKHISKPPYAKSRGIVLLELASSSNFEEEWKNIDLKNIEPFTIIAHLKDTFLQLRWNGQEKTGIELNADTHHIWSSYTLYEPEVILKRKACFNEFIHRNENKIMAEDLIHFHSIAQTEDPENGFIINRNGETLTKNITQVVLQKDGFKLLHLDLIQNVQTVLTQLTQ